MKVNRGKTMVILHVWKESYGKLVVVHKVRKVDSWEICKNRRGCNPARQGISFVKVVRNEKR